MHFVALAKQKVTRKIGLVKEWGAPPFTLFVKGGIRGAVFPLSNVSTLARKLRSREKPRFTGGSELATISRSDYATSRPTDFMSLSKCSWLLRSIRKNRGFVSKRFQAA